MEKGYNSFNGMSQMILERRLEELLIKINSNQIPNTDEINMQRQILNNANKYSQGIYGEYHNVRCNDAYNIVLNLSRKNNIESINECISKVEREVSFIEEGNFEHVSLLKCFIEEIIKFLKVQIIEETNFYNGNYCERKYGFTNYGYLNI